MIAKAIPLFLSLIGASNLAAQSIITTVAGTEWVFPGDGVQALSAPLGRITSIAFDPQGRLHFADQSNHMVMRVENGTIRVVAGNGLAGYSGDNGPATDASLFSPTGIAFGERGVLYIADQVNNRVRRVLPDGTISTIARVSLPLSLAVAPGGAVIVNESGARRIRRIAPNGAISTVADLGGIEGLALDRAGNLLLADFENNRVRVIAPDGGQLLAAGGGTSRDENVPASTAQLVQPAGITFDASGALYIAEIGLHRIRVVRQGNIRTLSGGLLPGFQDGPPASARFNSPQALAVDAAGNVFVADRENRRIRMIDPAGNVTTVAGSGQFQVVEDGTPALRSALSAPFGVSLDGGNLLVADTDNSQARRVSGGRVFGFAGNGVRAPGTDNVGARQSSLWGPFHVIRDRTGGTLISDGDDHRIRRVDDSGRISTIAGTGRPGLGGEGVPANSTPLAGPRKIAVDGAGNLYIVERLANRIRRVTSAGVITTVAGSLQGAAGFADGPAAQSLFDRPFGVALDSSGALIVTDFGNGRVRRIANGVVTTIAGGGNLAGAAADGNPAMQARLGRPAAVVVEQNGDIFFADAADDVVRRIRNGVLTTIAGSYERGFAGDGGLSTQARLNQPFGLASDGGTLYIADTTNNRIRAVRSAPANFDVSVQSLSFTAASDSAISAPQAVRVNSSVAGLRFGIEGRVNGGNWLQFDPPSGGMPSEVRVWVDPTGLNSGNFTASLIVSVPGAEPAQRSIPVRLTVERPAPPKAAIEPTELRFAYGIGDVPESKTLVVANRGSGKLRFAVGAPTEPWLSLTETEKEASSNQPVNVTVTADPQGLESGTYTTALNFDPGDGTPARTIPIIMTISERQPRILVSQTALRFTSAVNGGAPLAQTLKILNAGPGGLPFQVRPQLLSGNGWLDITPTSGDVGARGAAAGEVVVSVSPAGLAPGDYHALVRITDPSGAAINSPQSVAVSLRILPAGETPDPDIAPSSLVFATTKGENPGSQNVFVANAGTGELSFESAPELISGQAWLSHGPDTGTLAPGRPARIVVQPKLEALEAGVYRGTLKFRFSSGRTRVVDVVSIVSDGTEKGRAAGECAVAMQILSPSRGFTESSDRNIAMRVQMVDCNRTPQRDFAVLARVAGTTINMPLAGSEYTGTWLPAAGVTGNVSIEFIAERGGRSFLAVRDVLPGVITAPPVRIPPPRAASVTNSATLVERKLVAPGGLVTILGENLAESVETADPLRPPSALAGTTVELQGKPLPLLYASPTQINAQIPYGVRSEALQQIVVVRQSVPSEPEQLGVARTQPGILTVNQQGTGQAFAYSVRPDGQLGALADGSNPVKGGDVVVILCAGLGEVRGGIEAGAPPSEPAAVQNAVVVTIGGRPAQVTSQALSTQAVGRYDVHVVVPAGVAPGTVEVVLTTGGQRSQSASIVIAE